MDEFSVVYLWDGHVVVGVDSSYLDFYYYESVLSNHVTTTLTMMETGFEMDKSGKPKASKGLIDSLPIRGGERVDIIMEDNYGNELKEVPFKSEEI